VSLDENLNRVLARHEELSSLMSSGKQPSAEEFVRMSREYSELTPVVEGILALRDAEMELDDVLSMMNDPDVDAEMQEMAEKEHRELQGRLPNLARAVQILLVPKDEADTKNAILELRAGTGGDEAALFAADLFRMYQRYAENHKWKLEIMSMNEIGIGGIKEVIASVSGKNVFARLKFESGVHRVQRVPATESGGRIHTSAATVAVMPEAEEVDVLIEDKDLRIDVFRASGPGGQSVNTTDSAVRITHIPTGIVVSQQDEKSQHKNKAKGMRVLRARIYEQQRQKLDDERSATRRSQVGSGDRSERIRTYNFPDRRVTDHRIGLTVHQLGSILNGDMDIVIDVLITEDQAQKLAEIN
jgi:peptide chain release factor 1